MPVRADDFLSGVGTGRIGDHPESLQKLADSFMKGLGVSVEVNLVHGVSSHRKLANSISADQVVLLAIHNGDHWVVASDSSGSEIFYAYSASALNDPAGYSEDVSPSLKRIFNERAAYADLSVWERCALVLRGSVMV